MNTVTKVFETHTAHRLMNHPGKCKNLHGHTYRWEVTVRFGVGNIGGDGMVVDFGDVKRVIGKILDDHFDHALVLHQDDPLGDAMRNEDETLCVLLMDVHPTAENFAKYVFHYGNIRLRADVSDRLSIVSVRCWETPTSFAECRGE
jgi:6-pyruvoyltetrahydropterin/6-carboxytetrahydropterin synthase